ncbi:hypothetical protein DFAR_1690003 [Desulfarculales bacterium]
MLFEQVIMTLVREMSVLAAARIIGVSDTRLWLVVQFYVAQALSKMDLGGVKAVALDETASKRGHNYVTTFIDLNRKQKPVIFVTPGKGKGYLVWRRSQQYRRGSLRHVANLPGRQRRKLPLPPGDSRRDAALDQKGHL